VELVFKFSSLNEFLWMDGHGPYVWACYGITFASLIFLVVEPRLQKSRFIQQQKRVQAIRRTQAEQQQE